MTLWSMTGFARVDETVDGTRFAWEVKTVNARGLEVRLRLPPGSDALEPLSRAAIARRLVRGTCHANLILTRESRTPPLRVNAEALESLAEAIDVLRARFPDAAPPRIDGLLAVRGILETPDEEDDPSRAAEQKAVMEALERALEALVLARAGEGAALEKVLRERLDLIEALTNEAEKHPARQPEAIRQRLKEQVKALVGASSVLDADRLHQEAVMLASKADIREELDRLHAHITAARGLIDEGGPVGRRLDFLAQELGREANTLSAKSNDASLTAIGLELKATVEQFREQVQNVE